MYKIIFCSILFASTRIEGSVTSDDVILITSQCLRNAVTSREHILTSLAPSTGCASCCCCCCYFRLNAAMLQGHHPCTCCIDCLSRMASTAYVAVSVTSAAFYKHNCKIHPPPSWWNSILLSTHADRQFVDISLLFVCFFWNFCVCTVTDFSAED